MFSCAVGVAGYMDKFLRFIISEIGHQIHFLRFQNVFRSNISHDASPRFSLFPNEVLPDDGIGTALDSVADVLHVIGFSLLEILEHICKRARRFQ